jgi:hypothetical protein
MLNLPEPEIQIWDYLNPDLSLPEPEVKRLTNLELTLPGSKSGLS